VEIPDASHWVPLDAPDRLNELLLDWLTADNGLARRPSPDGAAPGS
jgi:hypothetical protein